MGAEWKGTRFFMSFLRRFRLTGALVCLFTFCAAIPAWPQAQAQDAPKPADPAKPAPPQAPKPAEPKKPNPFETVQEAPAPAQAPKPGTQPPAQPQQPQQPQLEAPKALAEPPKPE